MAARVGPKGQVVIEKKIRDRLGIAPGWIALQRVEGDHVEVRFLPPEHDESLVGSLAPHIGARVAEGAAWDEVRERAWSEAVRNEADGTDG